MPQKIHSFSARLSLHIILVATIAIVCLMNPLGHWLRMNMADEVRENIKSTLSSSVNQIEAIIASVESSTTSTAWLVPSHLDDEAYLYNLTRSLVQSNPFIVGSTVAFRPDYFPQRGHWFAPYSAYNATRDSILMFQLGRETNDYFTQDWYTRPVEERTSSWCSPYYDQGGGRMNMVTYSVPIPGDDGSIIAVVTADVALDDMTYMIKSVRPYADSWMLVMASNGDIIASPRAEYVMTRNVFELMHHISDVSDPNVDQKMMNRESGIFDFQTETDKCIAAYAPVSNGWEAALVCNYKAIFHDLDIMSGVYILLLVLALLIIYLFSWRAIRKLSKPITDMSRVATEMVENDFRTTTHTLESPNTRDELQQLYESFSTMQRSLADYLVTKEQQDRYQSELNIASSIQLHMLPTDFPAGVHAMLRPAKEVGGDLYTFRLLHGNRLFFVIGDVSGKGVPAALFMVATASAFGMMHGVGTNMADVMNRVNTAIAEGNHDDMFVTCFVGMLDLTTGHLDFCNAGHNPLVLIEPDGQARFLRQDANLALGLLTGFPYKGQQLDLQPGSRLLLYTDGVTEAENPDHQQYGEQRLLAFAAAHHTDDVQTLCQQLLQDIDTFNAGAPQFDDITILTIDYHGKTI